MDDAHELLIKLLREQMNHNQLMNYIVPGLASSLVGGPDNGKIRMFEATREARDFITPHSHRFDFGAIVLEGTVHNTLYIPDSFPCSNDLWCMSTIDQVCGENGLRSYVHTRDDEPTGFRQVTFTYNTGDIYYMTYTQIHSIVFEKGTKVLFFEGPQKVSQSHMLEPWVNGRVLPTFKTENWMFERVES